MRVRSLAGLFVSLALATGACTSDPDGPRRTRPSATGRTPGSGAGGTIDFGVIGEPATLDPYGKRASDLTYALVRPLYPSLFGYLPDGSVRADLATTMTPVLGGVRVDLRRAEWSSGAAITSHDVVASVTRARPPSGFAGLAASAVDDDTVELTGDVEDWASTLATAAFVLPDGKADVSVSGGPLRVTGRVPGLRIVYRPNPSSLEPVAFDRLRVFHVEDGSTLRSLLGSGELDAGLLPSSVNLTDRLRAADIDFDRALGWERIYLDLARGGLDPQARNNIAAALDRRGLAEGLIRSLGRVADGLHPAPGPRGADGPYVTPAPDGPNPSSLSLAVPEGDELLALLERAIQIRLADAGMRVDLVRIESRTFYAARRPAPPVDAGLVRRWGAPGLDDRDEGMLSDHRIVPLFHVETFIAGNGVAGYEVNPTLEGPLWNVTSWTLKGKH